MTLHAKLAAAAVSALAGTGILCPVCGERVPVAAAQTIAVAAQPTATVRAVSDTAVVKLHISGMTCGSCPVTARVALNKVAGVYSAKVTLDDSLGVVKYDPKRVTPAQITEQLTRRTGYAAKVIVEPAKPSGTDGR